jgi:hypothetical protein
LKAQDKPLLGRKREAENKEKDFKYSKHIDQPRNNRLQQHKGKTIMVIPLVQGKKNFQGQKTTPRKRQICNYYVNGACHKDDQCTYSHDVQQVRKLELCKYFMTNNCFKGDDCLYSHDLKSSPCKFFHAIGYCDKGEACKFSHNRLSEEQIKQFIEQNIDFLKDIYNLYGKSNMDDYFFQYIKEKHNQSEKEYRESIKVPSTAMIPGNMSQVNVNRQPVMPMNVSGMPLNNIMPMGGVLPSIRPIGGPQPTFYGFPSAFQNNVGMPNNVPNMMPMNNILSNFPNMPNMTNNMPSVRPNILPNMLNVRQANPQQFPNPMLQLNSIFMQQMNDNVQVFQHKSKRLL